MAETKEYNEKNVDDMRELVLTSIMLREGYYVVRNPGWKLTHFFIINQLINQSSVTRMALGEACKQ